MIAARPELEDFDAADKGRDPVRAARLARVREEGREAGYAEGFEAGEASARRADADAVAALREALADADLAQRAARADALAALRPLIEAMLDVAAPCAAAAALPHVVAEAVTARAAVSGQTAPVVRAPPDAAPALTQALEGLAEVRADAALRGAAARISWRDGGQDIDIDACLRATRDAVAALFGDTVEARPANDDAAAAPPTNSQNEMQGELSDVG